MTDDVGFGAPSTFGGVIPTPALDRVARAGLRYTSFNSTALCSPTRAALITGRNHHSVHTGVVVEQATGFPGYDTLIEKDTATIGEILKDNGYATAWFGKEHNTPDLGVDAGGSLRPVARRASASSTSTGSSAATRASGSRTCFATRRRSSRTSATRLEPHHGDGRRRHRSTCRPAERHHAGQAVLRLLRARRHPRPHHPTPEWIDKFKGKFDMGWNALREQIFANQKRLGVIPQNAQLTPWPKELPKWDTLPPEDKKLFARQAEVYAAYLAYTDHEIGRVDAGRAGHGQARQHARHLHQRRQRREPRGHAQRHAQRDRLAQRP